MSRQSQYRLRHVDQEDREIALENDSEDKNLALGIYGWKKRVLYCCVFLLFAIILLNIALTIWILAVLNFSVFGTGNIVFSNEGLQIKGPAIFDSDLVTSSIAATPGSQLKMSSQNAVSLTASKTTLLLQDEFVNVTAQRFAVRLPSQDAGSPDLLSVSGSTVSVGADMLRVNGGRGMVVSGPVTASRIRGPTGGGGALRVESPSGDLRVLGGGGLAVTSTVGNVEVTAGQDLRMESTGSITLSSDQVRIGDLLLGDGTSPQATAGYQLCSCTNGRLFLSTTSCATNSVCNSP